MTSLRGVSCCSLTTVARILGGCWFVILGTEDLVAAFELLQSRGVPFRCAPVRQSWGGFHAEFVDPDGNVFVLSQR
jgi:hypothetical protein